MAFPDWPLSRGSVNPSGWWRDSAEFLEHSHRYVAEGVALLIGILCAWVWQIRWAVPLAIGGSASLALLAWMMGAPRPIVAHVGLWGAATIFTIVLLSRLRRGDHLHSPTVRWLAFAAYLGVCAQAVMGGLRVTTETSGDLVSATTFRVVHGCFAQAELCLLVALAAILSPIWHSELGRRDLGGVRTLAWVSAAALFFQLVLGATMRHLGAGLAIPTFPQAAPDGSWWPASQNIFITLNYSHTRVGAVLVGLLVLWTVARCFWTESRPPFICRPASVAAVLLLAQIAMGVLVIWNGRPPILTTLHVVNGAALLATMVLLAVRASGSSPGMRVRLPSAEPQLTVLRA